MKVSAREGTGSCQIDLALYSANDLVALISIAETGHIKSYPAGVFRSGKPAL